ncbi:Transcription initiation factor TFIID subunit 15 [Bienertia sinuspersici]
MSLEETGNRAGMGGRAGGYKELDEEELEETRRRREAAEDDGEMYDEFGNLKKKFRAKTQQAETGKGLPGSGRAGWEIEEIAPGCYAMRVPSIV